MTMSSLQFRLASEADLPAICDILNQAIRRGGCNAFTEEVDLADRQLWLAQHPADRFPVYVAVVKTQIIAWVSFSPYRSGRQALAGVSEIAYYLHHDWQGQGYGKALLQFLIEEGMRLGLEHLLAILMDTNRASVRLLERHGFQRWAHLPDIARFPHSRAGQYYYGLDIRTSTA
ncbi:MAG: N-acetyltransferase family protein [Bacteroidetes bacterium]|nr:MAG: N-acetyltransferase family protein [Bacteroidota bacterium]